MNSNSIENSDDRLSQLKAAANNGNMTASYELGKIYEYEICDYKRALKYYKIASLQGDYKSKTNMGLMLRNGLGVARPDYRRAFTLFSEAASQGDKVAWYNIGQMHHNGAGEGFPINPEKAFSAYETSAVLGDEYAMFMLGRIYERGFHHIKQDTNKALHYYEKSVSSFNQKGTMEIPILYLFIGTLYFEKKDYEKAFENFILAADHDIQTAFFRTAVCLLNGFGTQKNLKKGFFYLKKAADQAKDDDAMLMVSDCLLFGNGIKKDEEESFEYLIKAAKNGNEKAKKMLQSVI